ncbi:MAG: hypothetical protein KAI70_00345 [Candidatus Omnitrophica bacterium]|nr:hypothetical protein [Candidatus Omnitrophota bacterium]
MGVLIFLFLPVCAAYENYSDVIAWEPASTEITTIGAHYYSWQNELKYRKNMQRIYDPCFFGLPTNTKLNRGGGPIQWTYLLIIGPKYAVRYKNVTYSNTSDVIYKVGYLPRPSRSLNSVTIDSVTASEAEYKPGMLKVFITCKWHTSSRRLTGGIKKKHYTTIIHQSSSYDYHQWVTADEYNETIECIITNHSGQYNTINIVGLPDNASHYNITVQMGNLTKSLLKSSYVYFKNETVDYQLYDMYDYDFYDLNGLSPYGKNGFLLPDGHIDDISVVVSLPFESFEQKTNITRKDEVEDIKTGDMCAVIMCLLSGYILFRMVR